MTANPPAYIIIELEIHDPANFENYRAGVAPLIASYGGCYLVRGGLTEVLEGDPPFSRVVMLEFPDRAAAQAFQTSDEYLKIAKLRHDSAKSRIYMVEGYNP